MMIKHYRITLGILLSINLITFLYAPEKKHFPWFAFFLLLYFIISFLKIRKQRENNKSSIPEIYIKNTNYIHINNNEKSTIISNKKDNNHN